MYPLLAEMAGRMAVALTCPPGQAIRQRLPTTYPLTPLPSSLLVGKSKQCTKTTAEFEAKISDTHGFREWASVMRLRRGEVEMMGQCLRLAGRGVKVMS